MGYRVLTVNREFGSGGGRIAQTIAEWLGWKLLDRDIIDAIAYAAHVDKSVVRNYDEHVVSWLRRINQQAMRSAALAAGLELAENSVFDAEEMVKISEKIILKAYEDGNCVIVGRGSQCVLQHKPDVFHVFVYAPLKERIQRLKTRLEKGADIEQGHQAFGADDDPGHAGMIHSRHQLGRRREHGVGAGEDIADFIDDDAEQIGAGQLGIRGWSSEAGQFDGGLKHHAAAGGLRRFGHKAQSPVQVEGGQDLAAQVDEPAHRGRGSVHRGDQGLPQDFTNPEQVARIPAALGFKGE